MEVDSVGAQSDSAAPATPARIPGIVAVVGDPIQFGGQQNGGQVEIPGFQNAAVQPFSSEQPAVAAEGGGAAAH